jgi:putative ATP-dependent endonuclease of the OLD family
MFISRIYIKNFRNFSDFELDLGENAVIVGENKIGKSNLIFALRLVLDPRLSDNDRQLRLEDFWDGLPRPLQKDDCIQISVDIADFEDDEGLMAILAEHLIQAEPMISRLTYLYRPKPGLENKPTKEADYEFLVFGADRPENQFGYETRKWMPLSVLPALRNAEDDLASWSHSPLAPLLRAVSGTITQETLEQAADEVTKATRKVAEIGEIKALSEQIQNSLNEKVGEKHSIKTNLGFSPADPNRLLRSLRLFIDDGKRGVGDASLGSANLLYLTLLTLELERQVQAGERSHTFLGIEEPEAHLHPHIQRLVFRDFLSSRTTAIPDDINKHQTVLLTTHSPHIVSVAPLNSIAVLRKSDDGKSTIGKSTAKLQLDDKTVKDLERYLDTNRGEIVFAKGVLLVEGPAEEFVVPRLGKLIGIDFDEMGISVCSVDGTNFGPYLQFLGRNGLNIPCAILTDLDPRKNGAAMGIVRTRTLMKLLGMGDEAEQIPDQDIPAIASGLGIFLNEQTFEIDLFLAGNQEKMCDVLAELTANGAATKRAMALKQDPATIDRKQFLKDIEEVGKGRFSQRLASVLDGAVCPKYISDAINYVSNCIY